MSVNRARVCTTASASTPTPPSRASAPSATPVGDLSDLPGLVLVTSLLHLHKPESYIFALEQSLNELELPVRGV
jgi:hypothetical protein